MTVQKMAQALSQVIKAGQSASADREDEQVPMKNRNCV
jgi:hypothetical protein